MSDTRGKPAVVVVPGAYHVPEHFEDLTAALQDLGHTVEAVRLPSTKCKKDPGNGLELDAAKIENAIRKFTESGQDVILHMHSYGGMAGSEAMHAFYERQRNAAKAAGQGKLRRAIFLAAFTPVPGENVLDCYKGVRSEFPTSVDEQTMIVTQLDSFSQYYTSTPRDLAEAANAKLVPMAASVFLAPAQHCGWRDHPVPITYVLTGKDYGLHTVIQERLVKRMEAEGVDLTVRRMEKADHSPFLHEVDEYLEVIHDDLV